MNLRNLIQLTANYPLGITAQAMADEAKAAKTIQLRKNSIPAPTTIYHYRNTLLHLGVFRKTKNIVQINTADPLVANLVNNLGNDNELSSIEKTLFGELIVNQKDCKAVFTDLFYHNKENRDYSLYDWLLSAQPLVWKDISTHENQKHHLNNKRGKRLNKDRRILLSSLDKSTIAQLSTPNHIQAFLYGIRYWFRDELVLIDEMSREDTGSIMFPILPPGTVPEKEILEKFIESLTFSNEWARKSLRDLSQNICIELKISIQRFHNFIRELQKRRPGYIVFIPTSRSFATVTASSETRELYELRSYLQDSQGIYISHIRVHERIKELIS